MSAQRDHRTYMGGRKPSNLSTPLGSACHAQGITAHALSLGTGIHARTLSDYFSNRIPIRSHHLPIISSFLNVEPGMLVREPEGGYDGEVMRIAVNKDARGEGSEGVKQRDRDYREEMVKPPGVQRMGGSNQ